MVVIGLFSADEIDHEIELVESHSELCGKANHYIITVAIVNSMTSGYVTIMFTLLHVTSWYVTIMFTLYM